MFSATCKFYSPLQVKYGKSDIGVGDLVINYNSLKYIDMTYMTYVMTHR